jgi:hypothetical protein
MEHAFGISGRPGCYRDFDRLKAAASRYFGIANDVRVVPPLLQRNDARCRQSDTDETLRVM